MENRITEKSLGANKPKTLNMMAKIGYLCLREIYLSFNQLHYLGVVNYFKHKYISVGVLIIVKYIHCQKTGKPNHLINVLNKSAKVVMS